MSNMSVRFSDSRWYDKIKSQWKVMSRSHKKLNTQRKRRNKKFHWTSGLQNVSPSLLPRDPRLIYGRRIHRVHQIITLTELLTVVASLQCNCSRPLILTTATLCFARSNVAVTLIDATGTENIHRHSCRNHDCILQFHNAIGWIKCHSELL
jgi:hypothetical protein